MVSAMRGTTTDIESERRLHALKNRLGDKPPLLARVAGHTSSYSNQYAPPTHPRLTDIYNYTQVTRFIVQPEQLNQDAVEHPFDERR